MDVPSQPDPPDDTAAVTTAESADLDAADFETLEEADPDPEPVTYSGTDFDVEGLVRRLERGDILIPTFGHSDETLETAGFQRRFVWRRPQMDRFIESLLLGYPIPGILLVQQTDKRYLVLDGQQRLRTLGAFYSGMHDKRQFALQNVGQRFKDLTYSTLPDELRRTLGNTFVPATVVKTDGSAGSLDAIYQIFERLNSGGTQLTPHEIRVALYAGPFVGYLTALNEDESWRELYGPQSPRLRDQELVLRFIALYVSPGDYKRPLKKYLNDFVARHRMLEGFQHEEVAQRFRVSVELLRAGPGRRAFRGGGGAVNAALTEAVLVGLARRLDAGAPPSPHEVDEALTVLLQNPDLDTAVSRATADEASVRSRLGLATRAFAAAE